MGDSWEYTVLWEFAGLTPPDFHEDQLNAIIDTLIAVQSAIGIGSGAVWDELAAVQSSGISSAAFDALYNRWNNDGRKALEDIDNTVARLVSVLSDVVYEIYQWKIRLVEVLGAADIGLAIATVETGGAAMLMDRLMSGVVETELKRKLQSLLDELEGKLLAAVIDGTPLKGLQHRVSAELEKLIMAAVDDAGATAGNYVRNT